jgi:serine phosphatase RsbU (regulator of sigma subunit)
MASSGLPYPVRCSGDLCEQIELPGVPLGSFEGVTYDEVTMPLEAGDLFVFCADGIFDAMNEQGTEFGTQRLVEVVKAHRHAEAPQNDDMTSVAGRITT